MVSVCDIMRITGTDKVTAHSYCEVYTELCKDFLDTALPIFEIGICEGYSLLAWKLIFPNAHIYGIDVAEKSMLTGDPRITTELLNANHRDKLTEFAEKYGPFQMIVDDGSHVTGDQINAHSTLFKYLAPGGVYVIEDIQDQISVDLYKTMPGATVYDLRDIKGRKDDVLVVFHKDK